MSQTSGHFSEGQGLEIQAELVLEIKLNLYWLGTALEIALLPWPVYELLRVIRTLLFEGLHSSF